MGSEPALSGSVIEKQERISPSSSGVSQRSACSGVPCSARISMLPVSGAEQLKTIGRDRAAAHELAEHPVLPVGQAGAVALVGEEQVPQPLGLGPLAQLDDDLRVGDARADLLVEGLDGLGLDGVDVLFGEGAHPLEQVGHAV